MNRAEQRRRTREALLEAAAQEFVARGYAQATLQGAADRLGLTRGTVLFHYKSKDALRDALVDWSDTQLMATLSVDRTGEPSRQFIATLLDLAGVYAGDVRVRAGLALQEERSREHPSVSVWRAALDDRAATFLTGQRADAGSDAGRSSPVAAVALTSMFLGIVREPTWTTERQLHEALDYLTSLILTR